LNGDLAARQLLAYGVVDPVLDATRVQAIVVVLTAAVTTAIAHVGDQLVVTATAARMGVQENRTT
jgi:hypothetical protein